MSYPVASAMLKSAFDPAMGRGYRIGQRVTLAPGETKLIINHGEVDRYHRWKITVAVEPTEGVSYPVRTARVVQVAVIAKAENDRIARRVTVQENNARVIYAPGRSIEVTVANPSAESIDVEFALDEASAGIIAWEFSDDVVNLAAEQDLEPPEFALAVAFYGLSGTPGVELKGYNSLGILVYSEILPAPRSLEVPLAPGLFYTVSPVAAPANGLIMFRCAG